MPRKSYEPVIRKVILRRIANAEPITAEAIINESGGSKTTVLRVINELMENEPHVLTGQRTRSTPERMRDMQRCIETMNEEKTALTAKVSSLEYSLVLFRDELQALIGQMVFTNRSVMQGLDEVRQTVLKIRPAAVISDQDRSANLNVLTEAKLQKMIQEVVRLSEENSRLRSLKVQEDGMF